MWSVLADVVVLVHLLFVAFVMAGGVLVLYRRRVAWLHLPAVAWGVFIEFSGRICPLTPLENELRRRGGDATYEAGFVEHYVIPVLYPSALTRDVQWFLGAAVIVINVAVYGIALGRRRNGGKPGS
jgi:hypothetical protein